MGQQGNAEPVNSAVPKPVVPAKRSHPSEDRDEATPLPSAQARPEVTDLTQDSGEEGSPAELHVRPDGDAIKLVLLSRLQPESLLEPKVRTKPIVPRADSSATNTRPSTATLAMLPGPVPLRRFGSSESQTSDATTTITAGQNPRTVQSLLQDEFQRIDRPEKECAALKVTNPHQEDLLAKLNLKHHDIVRERDDYRTKWEDVKQHNLILVARCQELKKVAGDLDTSPQDQRLAIHLAEEGWLEERARADRYKRAYEELQAKGTTSHTRSDPSTTIQESDPDVNLTVADPVADLVQLRLSGMIAVTTCILSRDNKYLRQPLFVVHTLQVPTMRALATLARSEFSRLIELEGLEQKCYWAVRVGDVTDTHVWSQVEADRFELWRKIIQMRGEWRNWEFRQAGKAQLNSKTGNPGGKPDGFALVVLAHVTKADDVERDIAQGRLG